MRFTKTLLVMVGVAAAAQVYAAIGGSVGFVQGNIWYSKEPFFAGNAVRIYSGVFNSGIDDIIGTVEFSDNGKSIGTSEFQAIGGGRLREVWIDWQATPGKHVITAKITKALLTRAGKPNETAQIISGDSGESVRNVDVDTDSDGVGNAVDTDDDNDGVSDVDELAKGTDPLNRDTDADGLPDGKDPAPTVQGNTPVSAGVSPVDFNSTKQVVASVAETVDLTADQLKVPLEAKKKELEEQIEAIKKIEAGVTQTKEGQSINDATGGNTVMPSRPTSTPGDTLKRIGLQLYRGAIILALYILDHKYLLYIVLAYILYKLVRFVFRRLLTRSA